jgi:hypothetical protein
VGGQVLGSGSLKNKIRIREPLILVISKALKESTVFMKESAKNQ